MDEKKLLEMAAVACEKNHWQYIEKKGFYNTLFEEYWNPLTFNKDAFEVETSLNINITWYSKQKLVQMTINDLSIVIPYTEDNKEEARRLGTTTIAAEIGKSLMENKATQPKFSKKP